MTLLRRLAIVLASSSCWACAATDGDGRGWIPLFNGRDLDGWTAKITGYEVGDNFADTFRVRDGLLAVSYDGYDTFDGRFGHLFHEGEFSHYRLRVEYRFVGEQVAGAPGWAFRNSGVMIHGQTPQSMTRDQEFPVSIEVQFLGGNGVDARPTANLCTPGTHVVVDGDLITRHCVDSAAGTYHGDDWVTIEVEVRGDRLIEHVVDGRVVLSYSETQLDPDDPVAAALIGPAGGVQLRGGTISLQSESHPIEFRRVEVLPLE